MNISIHSLLLILLTACIPAQSTQSDSINEWVKRINKEPCVRILNFFDQQEVIKKCPALGSILKMPAVQYPTSARLYKDTEIDHCYLLQDHNNNVFEAFEQQYPHFAAELETFDDIQKLFDSPEKFKRYFSAYLLLHDIGKPLGPLSDQHHNSTPIMRAYLQKWDFNQKQIALAQVLINNDIIGDMTTKSLSTEKAQEIITHNACQLNTHPKTLFTLHHLFWACDAGSYRSLKGYITTDKETGRLMPTLAREKVEKIAVWSARQGY